MRANVFIRAICFSLLGTVLLAEDGLPGAAPLTIEGDIASILVEGVDRFLLKQIDEAKTRRDAQWRAETENLKSPEDFEKAFQAARKELASKLGIRDPLVENVDMELITTAQTPSLVGRGAGFEIRSVRWPAFGDVSGEGLLLIPTSGAPIADVVAIPDCEQSPEQLVGLEAGIPAESQFARRLAESGCRVVVPALIDRKQGEEKVPGFGGKGISNREFLHRSAFELGRTLTGYEVQKVLAAVRWFGGPRPIGVVGYGEGGRLAIYAAALDPRVRSTMVSGAFGPRERMWEEPLDRNLFGALNRFGDAQLAGLLGGRSLVIEAAKFPEAEFSGEGGGAPARIQTPDLGVIEREFNESKRLIHAISPNFSLVVPKAPEFPFGTSESLDQFLTNLDPKAKLAANGSPPTLAFPSANRGDRKKRAFHEIDRHTQAILANCENTREQFMARLDTSTPEAFARTSEEYREIFARDVIGRFDLSPSAANPRARKVEENDKWVRYEVVLDVFPDVIAYGLMTMPRGIAPGEKRPVVVCQHGLEGRPQDTIGEKGAEYYSAFATQLAERGYITFSPQNLYIFRDRFRTLQRKANAIGKTLFSVIVPQHQQITDWLKTLPEVDGERIAYYGLSYGGKSAMRIPPLVKNYCLSICSADFNEWVLKNASTRHPFSYAWTMEYEIFEYDLGSTFNYAEMAKLIAPRPFMVERGHHDGVGRDEWVAYEFAKVYRFYNSQLRLGDRCEIEWFDGPHKINGVKTFEFLDKHLKNSPITRWGGWF